VGAAVQVLNVWSSDRGKNEGDGLFLADGKDVAPNIEEGGTLTMRD